MVNLCARFPLITQRGLQNGRGGGSSQVLLLQRVGVGGGEVSAMLKRGHDKFFHRCLKF